MTLEDLRNEINMIDTSLAELLVKRMACSENIAKVKHENGIPIFDQIREEAVLDRVKDAGGVYAEYIADIYRKIMDISKQIQKETVYTDGK